MIAGDNTRSASLTMMGATSLVEEAASAAEIEDSLWGCFLLEGEPPAVVVRANGCPVRRKEKPE